MEETRNSVTRLVSGLKKQSELIGRHIHHALCGHGGEYYVHLYAGKEKNSHAREIPVDGYETRIKYYFSISRVQMARMPVSKEKRKKFT